MKLWNSIKWMFFGSIFIGVFLNGMNILAYDINHLYFSLTLFYSALLMASNMSILEVFMHYSHSGRLNVQALLLFFLLSVVLVMMLRNQTFIGDEQWLKRMISHHSTALTTSYKISERTKNPKLKKLAEDIIKTQKEEIALMEDLLKKN